MKFNFPINNFSSGEWSPKMAGRTDTDQYAKSCEEITNFIPQMTGGATFRGGTMVTRLLDVTTTELNKYVNLEFEDEDENPYVATRPNYQAYKLIPFMPFQTNLSRILIISPFHWYMSSWFNGLNQEIAYGTNAAAVISAGNWAPYGTRYTVLGDLIILTNIVTNNRPLVFWYNTDTTTYRVDELERDYGPTNAQPWKVVPWDRIQTQGTSVTLTPSATTGSINIVSSAAKWVTGDIGSYVRFGSGSSPDGVARITGVTNSTTVTATVLKTLPATGAYGGTAAPTTFWQESAWSTRRGWPRTVVAHQGRLLFGGSLTAPDTLWGSRISNYFDFQEVPSPDTTGSTGFAGGAFTADNSRPFTLTPNSPEASAIVALSSGSTLTIHTTKSEIVAYGSNGALGPVNAVFESSTSYGAAPVQPVRVNNFVTFVQATGRNVRDIVYNSDEEQFKSTDLAFVVDHFFPSFARPDGYESLEELAKTENNSSVLWARASDGKVYAVTLDRDYRVNAWFRVPFGGSGEPDYDGNTEARVMSICSFVPPGSKQSLLYVLMYRVVNGSGYVTLEAIQPTWDLSNPANVVNNNAFVQVYLDGAVSGYKSNPTTWTTDDGGFYPSIHRGTTVSVVAENNYIGEYPVANDAAGTIVLPREYDFIYIGYKYKGRIVTAAIEQGGQTGVPMGRIKRVHELVLRLVNTLGIKYGNKEEMFEIPFRQSHAQVNKSVEYFTGDKVMAFPPGYDRKYQLVIEQDTPYPCHIVAIIPQGVTYD